MVFCSYFTTSIVFCPTTFQTTSNFPRSTHKCRTFLRTLDTGPGHPAGEWVCNNYETRGRLSFIPGNYTQLKVKTISCWIKTACSTSVKLFSLGICSRFKDLPCMRAFCRSDQEVWNLLAFRSLFTIAVLLGGSHQCSDFVLNIVKWPGFIWN